MRANGGAALFEPADGGVALVKGPLTFGSVGPLLAAGRDAIAAGRAGSIDLAGVDGADSAGLALLIEWLSIARQAGREIRYRNLPAQIIQLARLSEVEELLPTG
ncbi:MAG TPA: STAS domain-containing protein [Steroidobacteraceae bacterium]|nr:STAS domain-containing protein [Steroidobacteraceae bacterium]